MRYLLFTIIFLWSNLILTQVDPLINNDWRTFTWPYNAYYPESTSGVNGHVGNACGHTVMARVMFYWQFPQNGNGVLDFDDYFGYHWCCNLDTLNLDYSDMPYQLPYNASQNQYDETATLFLACGAVGEKIYVWTPNDGLEKMKDAFFEYFNYCDDAQVVNRWEHSREEWINIFKTELDNGRPIIIS